MRDQQVTRTRGRKWQRIRESVLIDSPLCVRCQGNDKITAASEVDHIIPLHQGGTDDPANLQALCHDCHAEKTATEQGKRTRPEIGVDGWPVDGGGGQIFATRALETVREPSL